MVSFFISDLHLNENYPASYNLFLKFSENLPTKTDAVYILGDLFEFWVDDKLNTKFIQQVKNILKNISSRCPVYLIHGNRDFLIGKLFAAETKVSLLPDPTLIELYGNKILLSHGDLLCSNDLKHIYFRKLLSHPITIKVANFLPISWKLLIANKLRKLSIYRAKHYIHNNQSKKIYDVCETTVQHIMQQYGGSILIHGHTHKPKIHAHTLNLQKIDKEKAINKNFTRIVLGDWHNTAKILTIDHNGFTLQTITI